MAYLSVLKLNLDNPLAWRDAVDRYSMHQTLYRVMPPEKHSGQPRHLLFRVDILPKTGDAYLIVQSQKPIDWHQLPKDYAEATLRENAPFNPSPHRGDQYRFRLLAKPTKRKHLKSMSPQEAARYRKTGPRRLLLTEEEKVEWLKRKGEENGFRILQCVLTDFRVDILKKDAPAVNVGATQFDGILEVTDPDAFHRALISGIGTQKGFGFGLLSIVSPPNPVTQEATE